jgi:hypothetical protein
MEDQWRIPVLHRKRRCVQGEDALGFESPVKSRGVNIKTTDTRPMRKTVSLAWGVPSYIFGGPVEELGVAMLKTVEFKHFFGILLAQVDTGVRSHEVDWAPIVETVMRPLEFGTPQKVKFQDETLSESLEALGWTDGIPRGASTLGEDSDLAFDDSLCTNQMDVYLKFIRINVEALEIRVAKYLISNESTLESLGSQIQDTRVGKDPGMYTSGEESVWEVYTAKSIPCKAISGRILLFGIYFNCAYA